MQRLETKLHNFIGSLFEEIKAMHPSDGLHSPRDIELVREINKKVAIMDHMQNAMRVINKDYEIRN